MRRRTGARNADRRRAARLRRTPPATAAHRRVAPPRRVSGPSGGRLREPSQGCRRPTRHLFNARQPSNDRSPGAASRRPRDRRPRDRAAPVARALPARPGAFASGSGAVAAAVALPLRSVLARSRPAARARPAPAACPDERAKPDTGVGRRIGAAVLSLPDHHLLDRVIRGRAWIPLLGVLLAGIVATQVEILKLGASMGRSLEQTSSLTSQNE